MNTIVSRSRGSSVVGMSDLDGYSFQEDMNRYEPATNLLPTQNSDFGFDPPTSKALLPKSEAIYSPTSVEDMEMLANWPGFDQHDHNDSQHARNRTDAYKHGESGYDMMGKPLPANFSAVSRYGQITPPRSNSATSSGDRSKEGEEDGQRSTSARGKRNTRTDIKNEAAPKAETSVVVRKRKGGRKALSSTAEPAKSPQDDRRKMSLEKNRLAAAKCRVNKKEKTDQLQQDSHDKAVQNTFLKETIMDMKGEIQQLQTFLMSHSTSDGCKNPEDIHKALSSATADQYPQQMNMPTHHFEDFVSMHGQPHDGAMRHDQPLPVHDGYFQSREAPPLPEFNSTADFVVQTPM